ncbi:MAG: S9 family peptidase [Flavobacteriales bacterium]|nr:S9 family peptidase [Flavobacteriales bacterium]
MKKLIGIISLVAVAFTLGAQNLTPEMLAEISKVSAVGITKDGKSVVYKVRQYNIEKNEGSTQLYIIPIEGGEANPIDTADDIVANKNSSPDGKSELISKEVKIEKVFGSDYYPELADSDMMIYDDLSYRHWDIWEDGMYGHVMIKTGDTEIDLMRDQPYDCPQKPFGGDEDYIWGPEGKTVLYVTKQTKGKEYATSTNTDIYEYNLATKKTINLTTGMMGYDLAPAYSSSGILAWLCMERDGYESDKNDIIVLKGTEKINLTKDWDGTVSGFLWSTDAKTIYFTVSTNGTKQVFKVNYDKKVPAVTQITKGEFDIRSIVGQSGNILVVNRTDMNHANELFTVDVKSGDIKQLTNVNKEFYNEIGLSKVERRTVKTTDGQDMLVWVIYPPEFDASKKYPTLLYCQGGPQSALSQFYSSRWNFQLMTANGYIVVAPNRRGMPGHGVKWNEAISKDYGGMPMQDYLSAIDEIAKEPFVDNDRIGCLGASFGGYSVFQLAGTHEKRFKTFISHDGIFNWRSMYGTTEELFFVNWDLGGNYWDLNEKSRKAYNEFNPVSFVHKWDTPILIIQGGKDYRVPIGQGLEAFNAAQLKGIKSRLLYFPNENHWVLQSQNSLIWQHEFYRWLKETL